MMLCLECCFKCDHRHQKGNQGTIEYHQRKVIEPTKGARDSELFALASIFPNQTDQKNAKKKT